ncbi:MAG: type II toxin-antitoxin system PemK/MazF family toxin [Bacteroidota bacterium]|nr:type II toxin-antitoxin system PemK/MazF family toxin [Bacteroidota bacterium]
MRAGNIVLIEMPQSDGKAKLRPALLLKVLPQYNDFLVCGISSQINQHINGYDEILYEETNYFSETGLRKTSLIRLFFIAIVPGKKISGGIGKIPTSLHQDLLERLAKFLVA